MQKFRTLTLAKIRMSPGYIDKPSTDIYSMVDPDCVLQATGTETMVDSLNWIEVHYAGAYYWVAEATQNGTPILIEQPDKPTVFDTAFAFVIRHEGGFLSAEQAARLGDAGGATRYGLSQRSYPGLNLDNLTLAAAKEIYFRDYWQECGAEKLDAPLAVQVFDMAVNGGLYRSAKIPAACGGDYHRYAQLRRDFYNGLTNFPAFGAGWLRRVDECEKLGERLEGTN